MADKKEPIAILQNEEELTDEEADKLAEMFNDQVNEERKRRGLPPLED